MFCFFYGKEKKIICYCQIHTLSVALQSKQKPLNGLAHISLKMQVRAPHKVEKYICWLKMKQLFSYIHPEQKKKKKKKKKKTKQKHTRFKNTKWMYTLLLLCC